MLWFIICIVLMIFLGPDIGLICPILFIWYKVGFPQYIIMFFGAG